MWRFSAKKCYKFWLIFPPICKSFGLFFAKLLKCGLFLCQNQFWHFLELFGYFWGQNLVALPGPVLIMMCVWPWFGARPTHSLFFTWLNIPWWRSAVLVEVRQKSSSWMLWVFATVNAVVSRVSHQHNGKKRNHPISAFLAKTVQNVAHNFLYL